MSAAEIIKEIRKRLGNITQTELARRLGVTKGSVSQWEKGIGLKKSNAEKLIALARNLGISLRELELIVSPGLILLDGPVGGREIPLMQWDQVGELHSPRSRSGKKARRDGPAYGGGGVTTVRISDNLEADVVAAAVADESMEPELYAGDIIIFSAAVKPKKQGDLVVALVDESELVLRHYASRGYNRKGVEVFDLLSTSPDFPTIPGSGAHNIKILGTVVERRLMRR